MSTHFERTPSGRLVAKDLVRTDGVLGQVGEDLIRALEPYHTIDFLVEVAPSLKSGTIYDHRRDKKVTYARLSRRDDRNTTRVYAEAVSPGAVERFRDYSR